MAEGVRRTVEAVVGDRLTEFRIQPPVTLGKLVGLPRPRFYGSAGPETVDLQGMWPEQDGASVVTVETWALQGGSAIYTVESYQTAVADHLDRLAAADAASAAQQ
jgi:hypothetical protein